jgi:hypothetical protein
MSPTAIIDGQNGAEKQQAILKQVSKVKPLDRTWRGDKAGKVVTTGIPKFESKYAEREWIKVTITIKRHHRRSSLFITTVWQEHMAAAFRYWGKLGFGEGTAGHITVR